MPRRGVFSAQEVCRILQKNGFSKIRQSGSHLILQKKLMSDSITVPVPNHPEIAKGTLKSIIRQSGLDPALFIK
jgi:predicted RNA binding protein YcfA (HicA-like mRNA interferase family)